MKVGPNIFPTLGLLMQGDLGPYTCYTKPRRRIVIFLRAPPKTPETYDQRHQRNLWKEHARIWQQLSPDERTQWQLAATLGRLRIAGYNLFLHARSNTNSNTHLTIAKRYALTLHTSPGF